jgi:aspartate aminotransferase
MIRYSRHAGGLVESETLAIAAKANRLRAQGIRVAPFAAGEPDFDTPAHIKEAGHRAIREGRTRYTPVAGIAPLREAVAEKFRAAGLEGVTADRTLVGVGAKGVLYLALQVLVEEGDEVIVPSPCWLSYRKMIEAAGGRAVFVESKPEEGFLVDPDRVRAAVTARTKAVVVNSPCNPTGAVQPDEAHAEIGRLAAERGLVVISDEIYEDLTYEPARFRSFAAAAPEARDLTLLVNGVSKAYAMTGWRIGFGAGPAEMVQRMIRLQSHALSAPPDICQRAALEALLGPRQELEQMRRTFAERRRIMYDALAAIPDVRCRLPEGAFYILPDVSAYFDRRWQGRRIGDATTLCDLLLEHAHAAVVPGDPFEAPYALRFSYACSREDIVGGMERVAGFLARLQPPIRSSSSRA